MNKRIKELALEAGGSFYPDVNPVQLEKFAELIIKECGIVVNKANYRLGQNIDKLFEMHFGDKK